MSYKLSVGQSWLPRESVFQISRAVLECINSKVSNGLIAAIDSGDHAYIVNCKVDASEYDDSLAFARDYQAVALLKKAEFLKTGIDKRLAARVRFEDAEKQCRETNSRLAFLNRPFWVKDLHDPYTPGVDATLFRCLMKAQELVHTILGPVPDKLDFRFGPGQNSLIKKSVTLPKKYAAEVQCTPELYQSWRDVVGPNWARNVTDLTVVAGADLGFVPKDGKTDRTIGTEPHLNIYAQLGVGKHMRLRLKPWVDLDVGQYRNRSLAMIAQSTELSTIDFANASDTVSRALVQFLLPHEWVDLLDRVRSHTYKLDGETKVFHKHSSMGNGYTFELESIIFYALARACTVNGHHFFGENVSVYGDDVILPAECADLFIEICAFVGFTVNRDKSFLKGRFFESCGSDYFDGKNVRPVAWKRLNPLFGFKVHNDIIKMAHNLKLPKLFTVADTLRLRAPSGVRSCLIPEGYGDIGFVTPFDAAVPSVKRGKDGWCGFITSVMQHVPVRFNYSRDARGLLASLDTQGETSSAPVRGSGDYRVTRLHTFGSWETTHR